MKSPTLKQLRLYLKEIGVIHPSHQMLKQLQIGYKVELEHGTVNPLTNITNDDPMMTIKIALAHLMEHSDYYTLLTKYGL